MKQVTAIIASLLMISFGRHAQAQSEMLSKMEDSLYVLADSINKNAIPEARAEINIRFGKMLVRALELPGSFNYPFTHLAEKIHILYPEDRSFRIFNWVLAYTDNGRRYYGAIQMRSDDKLNFIPLKDVSAKHTKDAQDVSLVNGEWFGGEYYKIKTQTLENGAKLYTLLGYNNDGSQSTRKFVDLLMFENGQPVFGFPAFAVPGSTSPNDFKKRFVLEYKKEAQVGLNYNDEIGIIVFDRLTSEVNNPNVKSTYVPSGQTDGLQWTGRVWRYVQDAIQPLQLKDGQAPINGVMQGGN